MRDDDCHICGIPLNKPGAGYCSAWHSFASSYNEFQTMCNICGAWARTGMEASKFFGGKHWLSTNHHVNCPHYNDSLIDVWKITDSKITYWTNDEKYINDIAREDFGDLNNIKIIKEKIHKEIYDHLSEFEGF